MEQIPRQGLPHILWDGEPVLTDTLPPDPDPSLFPIDVLQLQVDHFSGTQAEPGQKEQDRIVPLAYEDILTASLENPLDLLRFKKLR
jgi:hypothetical protein